MVSYKFVYVKCFLKQNSWHIVAGWNWLFNCTALNFNRVLSEYTIVTYTKFNFNILVFVAALLLTYRQHSDGRMAWRNHFFVQKQRSKAILYILWWVTKMTLLNKYWDSKTFLKIFLRVGRVDLGQIFIKMYSIIILRNSNNLFDSSDC